MADPARGEEAGGAAAAAVAAGAEPAPPTSPAPPPADGPAPAPAMPDVPPLVVDDATLRRRLLEREREEEEEARALARGLAPGDDCPVCGEPLVAVPAVRPLTWLRRRPALTCMGCHFEAGPLPNHAGWLLLSLLALTLAAGGVQAVLAAQRLPEGRARAGLMAAGILGLVGGALLGWSAELGGGNTQHLAARILRGRRRRAGEPDDEHLLPSPISENLEAVVVAIVLALVIRHAVMEAFVIPTGSMAPTLLGDHVRFTCTACGHAFDVGKAEGELDRPGDEATFTARCPLCDEDLTVDLRAPDVRGGDKILVNKFVYEVRPPRRWEVVVFKFPRQPWKNYIKRLVGLPGESLEVENGDVFVDGARARKPDDVQDAIWIPVHDAAAPRRDGRAAWRVLEDEAHPLAASEAPVWATGDGRRLVCTPRPGEDPPWLEYARGVRDQVGYNKGWGSHDSRPVADLRVRTVVIPGEGSSVRLAVAEDWEEAARLRTRVVAVTLPVGLGDGELVLEVDGARQGPVVTAPALRPGAPVEVTLAYADDRARVLVDGRCVVAWDDPFGPAETCRGTVRLGARGGPVAFERTRIDRDVHYVNAWGSFDPSDHAVLVPEGSYFVLGDNSPSSQDGRAWGFLREGHLVGRAFLVFWPLERWSRVR